MGRVNKYKTLNINVLQQTQMAQSLLALFVFAPELVRETPKPKTKQKKLALLISIY